MRRDASTRAPVALRSHSYGANCAIGGAARTRNVSHLILCEPSLGLPCPPGAIERVEAALARGDREAAIAAVFVEILEMAAEERQRAPGYSLWHTRLDVAHTITPANAGSMRAVSIGQASSMGSAHPPCCCQAVSARQPSGMLPIASGGDP